MSCCWHYDSCLRDLICRSSRRKNLESASVPFASWHQLRNCPVCTLLLLALSVELSELDAHPVQVQACLQREPTHRPTATQLLAKLLKSLHPQPPSDQQRLKATPSQRRQQQAQHQSQCQVMQKQRPASAFAFVHPTAACETKRQQLQDVQTCKKNAAAAVAHPPRLRTSEVPKLTPLPTNNPRAECGLVPANHASACFPSSATCEMVKELPQYVTPSKVCPKPLYSPLWIPFPHCGPSDP
jgi:hypothetical protein